MRAASLTRIGAPALAGALALGAAAVLAAQAGAAPVPVTVSFREFLYRPAAITVKVGQRVIFRNAGKIAHTVANTDAKGELLSTLIKPRNLDPGQAQTVSFARPGTVFYLCTFHPTLMRGRIVVTS